MNKKNYLSLAWFILGFGLSVFTRMSKLVPTIPMAILIAPVFILRFSRTQPVRRGNLLTLFGFYLSINIGLWWLYETNTLFNAVKILLLALLYSLPFMIDGPIHEKFTENGISSGLTTLTFPIISTAIHFLSSLEGFFEGTVQIGKFVFGPVILQQFLSLFGICGFIFIASWFASTINYAWENGFDWGKSRKIALTFAAVSLAIFVFGAVKTSSNKPERDTVTVAVDFNGNVLNQMDFADPGDGIMYAELPMQGVNTLYTRIGDVLGWICVVGLLGLVPISIVLRFKLKKQHRNLSKINI